MTSPDDRAEFRESHTFTGDAEHNLFAKTLAAMEQRIDMEMGWDAAPSLFLLSADPDAQEVAVQLIPPRRWRTMRAEEHPAASLLGFARSLGGPAGFRTRSFADSPAGRCGFAFLTEGLDAPLNAPAWAKPVAKRFILATDIGGRRYLLVRERGATQARYFSIPGTDTENADEIPTALWLLTAALISGAFTPDWFHPLDNKQQDGAPSAAADGRMIAQDVPPRPSRSHTLATSGGAAMFPGQCVHSD